MSKSRKAFTLVELLVVIAIIAVLAAILFPVFGRARENARRTTCLSNIRMVGMGLFMYTQDYDERYPGFPNNSFGKSAWTYVLQPYVKSKEFFRCPSDKSTANWAETEEQLTDKNFRKSSYTWNGFFDPGSVKLGKELLDGGVYTSVADIAYPSELVMLAEGFETNQQTTFNANKYASDVKADGSPCACGSFTTNWDAAKQEPTDIMVRRHFDGSNYAYADGHAKWNKFQTLWYRDDSYITEIPGVGTTPSLKGAFDPRRR